MVGWEFDADSYCSEKYFETKNKCRRSEYTPCVCPSKYDFTVHKSIFDLC